jgi:hypothetical protein
VQRGSDDLSEAAQSARETGAPEHVIASLERPGSKEQTDVAIWPENWQSVLAFASVVTQWRIVPLASGKLWYAGLDYAGVRAGLEAEAFELTPALWADLRTMEAAAREAANAR